MAVDKSPVEGKSPAEGTPPAKATVKPRLTSGFVFKSVFGDSKERCKTLVEMALDIQVSGIEFVQPEREFDVSEEHRAGRVDLFVKDSDGNRYDIEMQARQNEDELLRARHYQALMDVSQLRSGKEAKELRGSIVIFICDFDPLNHGFKRYDCRTVCLETGEVVPDGRRLVILNAKGEKGEVSPGLDAFLKLVAGEEVEGDSFVDHINDMIKVLVDDPEWLEAYMTLEDELRQERRYGERIGMEKGLAQGRAETVAKVVGSGAMSVEAAAALFEMTVDEVRAAMEGAATGA